MYQFCCRNNEAMVKQLRCQFTIQRFLVCSVHWGIKPLSKIPALSFLPYSPLSLQTFHVPLFRQSAPLYQFFRTPPKSRIFQSFSSLTSSYLLKVTKNFLVKCPSSNSQLCQRKTFFVVKYFKFQIIAISTQKRSPRLFQQPPSLKIKILSSRRQTSSPFV